MSNRKLASIIALLFAAAAVAAAQSNPPGDTYADRLEDLEQAHQDDPKDLTVLDSLAGSYAMGGRYKEAIEVVKEMVVLQKTDSALIFRLAQLFAWNGEADQSLEELRRLDLRHDVEAAEFECEVFAGARRALQAEHCYAGLLQVANLAATQRKLALLGRARNGLWSGKWPAAARSYEEYLKSDPSDEAVTKEYIKLLQYKGDYAKAEKFSNQLLGSHPNDAGILALRADVLFWAGHRSSQALRDARRAVDLSPDVSDVRLAYIASLEALGLNRAASQEVHAFRDTQSRPPDSGGTATGDDMADYLGNRLNEQTSIRSDLPFSVYNDSDGIHNAAYQAALSIPIRGDLVAPGMNLSVHGGASTRSGAGSLRPIYSVTLSKSSWDRWSVALGANREFLKVTPRAIDQDISSYAVFADLRYFFDARTSADLKVDRKWWSDANHSNDAEAVLSRTVIYGRRFSLDGGGLGGYQAFDRNTIAVSGFFTPDRYTRYAGFVDLHGEAGRMTWEVRGEGGTQQIVFAANYNPAWDVTSRFSIRVSRALRLFGSYERRNYSLLERNGWYQGFYVSLGFQP
jgi:Flp pilus assembly protein TadD